MNHNDFWNKQPQRLKRGHEALVWFAIVIAACIALYHALENLKLIK